ncbi:DUF3348 family protein [Caenimonas soli]|uniref:DUF3348 family protein n=1 Tax=Caenimonas soli TaxID=2735555 RepID=UPI0015581C52|nr:DUF3348 family protein [Caenimonas soli]NPC58733.1 DUF3348 family protein [Caenimonas soli]
MRRDFNSSKLVRLLGEWAPVDAEAPGMDFAERLSLWLNAFDAIGLQAAHQSIKAIKTAAPGKPSDARFSTPAQAIEEEVQRVRTALARAIARNLIPLASDKLPQADAGYSPYRRRHLELQRQMEQMITPLRDHVRQTLCRISARLRQLAALDAVLEQLLAPREQLLLPEVASLMERRFEQLARSQAGGWLEAFARDWRLALLAELDLRLEPVAGLIEALNNELKYQQ